MAPWLLGCTGAPSPPDLAPTVELATLAQGTATFRWDLDEGTHRIEYGQDALDRSSASVEGAARIQLTGLRPGEPYRWRAVSETVEGLRTSPEQTLDVPATDAPPWQLLVADPARSELAAGAALVTIWGETGPWTGMVDGLARWVWVTPAQPGLVGNDPQLGLDGRSVLTIATDVTGEADLGEILRVDLDGAIRSRSRAETLHHGVEELADGSATTPSEGEFVWLGHDFRELSFEGTTWTVETDTLLRGPEGGGAATEWFNLFDDYGSEFYVPCSHTSNETSTFGMDGLHEWTHSNSLVHVEEEDAWYVGVRLHDALLRIDGAGARSWVMGGPSDEWAFEPGAAWSHGHFSEVWPGGMLLLDNGAHHVPQQSRALEVAWDEATRTVRLVWEFPHPDGAFVAALGDVKRLPGGNRLIAWGDLGELTEVTPEGEVVFHADLPGHALGRTQVVPLPITVQP